MKKSDILAKQWLETKEITVCGGTWSIRELSAAKRNDIRAEYTKLKESEGERASNDYLVQEYCYASVVDEDGVIVFDTPEEQANALSLLPQKWFTDVFQEVADLNGMEIKTDEEIEKKSALSTEAQTTSSGSEGSEVNSDTPVSEECSTT